MSKYVSALLCALLMGCMASGTQVKEQQLTQFKVGKTTCGEVIAALGSPNMNSLLPNGERMIAYKYTQVAARPESFIPIVGPFVGGADVRGNMVMLIFSVDGTLKNYSSNSMQSGGARNLAAGPTPPRNDEPKTSTAP